MKDSFRTTIVFCAGLALPAPLAAEGAPACAAFPVGQAEYTCSCAVDSPSRSVWGSALYTTDSDICTAARHAGVLGPGGGTVRMIAMPGQPVYRGSVQNGVTTADWGPYDHSFQFQPLAPAPAPVPVLAGPACGKFPPGQQSYACTCPAGAAPGAVWGSGPYVADSDICTAARHAGVIAEAGGAVVALAVAGLPAYRGSPAHGVASTDWGAYPLSYVFDANQR